MESVEDEDTEDIYEVKKILDKSVVNGVTLYKVRWKGFSEPDDTWEPEENLDGCTELVEKFLRKRAKRGAMHEKHARDHRHLSVEKCSGLDIDKRNDAIEDADGETPTNSTKLKKAKKRRAVLVSSSDEEADTLKDHFWKDLEKGKLPEDLCEVDLYTSVKSRGRNCRPICLTEKRLHIDTPHSSSENDAAGETSAPSINVSEMQPMSNPEATEDNGSSTTTEVIVTELCDSATVVSGLTVSAEKQHSSDSKVRTPAKKYMKATIGLKTLSRENSHTTDFKNKMVLTSSKATPKQECMSSTKKHFGVTKSHSSAPFPSIDKVCKVPKDKPTSHSMSHSIDAKVRAAHKSESKLKRVAGSKTIEHDTVQTDIVADNTGLPFGQSNKCEPGEMSRQTEYGKSSCKDDGAVALRQKVPSKAKTSATPRTEEHSATDLTEMAIRKISATGRSTGCSLEKLDEHNAKLSCKGDGTGTLGQKSQSKVKSHVRSKTVDNDAANKTTMAIPKISASGKSIDSSQKKLRECVKLSCKGDGTVDSEQQSPSKMKTPLSLRTAEVDATGGNIMAIPKTPDSSRSVDGLRLGERGMKSSVCDKQSLRLKIFRSKPDAKGKHRLHSASVTSQLLEGQCRDLKQAEDSETAKKVLALKPEKTTFETQNFKSCQPLPSSDIVVRDTCADGDSINRKQGTCSIVRSSHKGLQRSVSEDLKQVKYSEIGKKLLARKLDLTAETQNSKLPAGDMVRKDTCTVVHSSRKKRHKSHSDPRREMRRKHNHDSAAPDSVSHPSKCLEISCQQSTTDQLRPPGASVTTAVQGEKPPKSKVLSLNEYKKRKSDPNSSAASLSSSKKVSPSDAGYMSSSLAEQFLSSYSTSYKSADLSRECKTLPPSGVASHACVPRKLEETVAKQAGGSDGVSSDCSLLEPGISAGSCSAELGQKRSELDIGAAAAITAAPVVNSAADVTFTCSGKKQQIAHKVSGDKIYQPGSSPHDVKDVNRETINSSGHAVDSSLTKKFSVDDGKSGGSDLSAAVARLIDHDIEQQKAVLVDMGMPPSASATSIHGIESTLVDSTNEISATVKPIPPDCCTAASAGGVMHLIHSRDTVKQMESVNAPDEHVHLTNFQPSNSNVTLLPLSSLRSLHTTGVHTKGVVLSGRVDSNVEKIQSSSTSLKNIDTEVDCSTYLTSTCLDGKLIRNEQCSRKVETVMNSDSSTTKTVVYCQKTAETRKDAVECVLDSDSSVSTAYADGHSKLQSHVELVSIYCNSLMTRVVSCHQETPDTHKNDVEYVNNSDSIASTDCADGHTKLLSRMEEEIDGRNKMCNVVIGGSPCNPAEIEKDTVECVTDNAVNANYAGGDSKLESLMDVEIDKADKMLRGDSTDGSLYNPAETWRDSGIRVTVSDTAASTNCVDSCDKLESYVELEMDKIDKMVNVVTGGSAYYNPGDIWKGTAELVTNHDNAISVDSTTDCRSELETQIELEIAEINKILSAVNDGSPYPAETRSDNVEGVTDNACAVNTDFEDGRRKQKTHVELGTEQRDKLASVSTGGCPRSPQETDTKCSECPEAVLSEKETGCERESEHDKTLCDNVHSGIDTIGDSDVERSVNKVHGYVADGSGSAREAKQILMQAESSGGDSRQNSQPCNTASAPATPVDSRRKDDRCTIARERSVLDAVPEVSVDPFQSSPNSSTGPDQHGVIGNESENSDPADRLFKAIARNDITGVKSVLDAHGDVDVLNRLDSCSGFRFSPLMSATCLGHVEMVNILVVRGAAVNSVTANSGLTALMVAASQGSVDIVHCLLMSGAYIDVKDNVEETALIKAAGAGHPEIVKQLLDYGANVPVSLVLIPSIHNPVKEMLEQHLVAVTESLEAEVCGVLNGTGSFRSRIFHVHCVSLLDAGPYHLSFKFNHSPPARATGNLAILFIGLARVKYRQIKCGLFNWSVIERVTLNGELQKCLFPEINSVYHLTALRSGDNSLVVHPVFIAPEHMQYKLLMAAYEVHVRWPF